jgi:hypothetical protein
MTQHETPTGELKMTTREASLVTLSSKMMLTVSQAVALPLTIEIAARKVGMSEGQMIDAAMSNGALCQYLANACRVAVS